MLQDPLHWPMTAANNVRIGRLDRPDPGDAAFADAAARSGADAVLATLPDGAATMLSRQFQKGRDLSGGQWQRLSVARGLYRDAPLVIADEPTAAMDARAEHAVFTALRGLGGSERITVLVTHRLANVRHADQIVVLEDGRVTELGTHAELMAARRHLPRAVLAAGARVRGHLSKIARRGAGSTHEPNCKDAARWDAPRLRPAARRRCAGPCSPSRSSCVGGSRRGDRVDGGRAADDAPDRPAPTAAPAAAPRATTPPPPRPPPPRPRRRPRPGGCGRWSSPSTARPTTTRPAPPRSRTRTTTTQEAGGTGTYADPLSLAADPRAIPVGTRVYYPQLRKYFVMEDDCAQCITDWRSSRTPHIDLWTGNYQGSALIACENALTPDGRVAVEVNPPPGRPVDPRPRSTRPRLHRLTAVSFYTANPVFMS